MKKDNLIVANKKFNSRLIVGTGKYKSMAECAKAIKLSGAEIVTVAVRRVTNIKIIREQTKLPLIIDAGLGQASDATIAMELGCDGVLVNTAIAKAKKPFEMALAFKNAVIAGRQSFLAGRIDKYLYGNASSPKTGIIK